MDVEKTKNCSKEGERDIAVFDKHRQLLIFVSRDEVQFFQKDVKQESLPEGDTALPGAQWLGALFPGRS